jgi:hypothetical protein
MKIIFTLGLNLFLLFLPGGSLQAQRFTGGLSAGLIASQVDGDTYKGYDKAGITAGGWVNLSMTEHSAFQVGLNYIQKGSRHNPDYDKGDNHFLLIRLGYVEMPLLYQYIMKNRFYLETGPSIGVLLHSFTDANDGSTTGILADNAFRLLDISANFGIGYRYSEKLRIGLRNGNSLSTIRKERVTGDRWRLWGYGQFNNLLALELMYRL